MMLDNKSEQNWPLIVEAGKNRVKQSRVNSFLLSDIWSEWIVYDRMTAKGQFFYLFRNMLTWESKCWYAMKIEKKNIDPVGVLGGAWFEQIK